MTATRAILVSILLFCSGCSSDGGPLGGPPRARPPQSPAPGNFDGEWAITRTLTATTCTPVVAPVAAEEEPATEFVELLEFQQDGERLEVAADVFAMVQGNRVSWQAIDVDRAVTTTWTWDLTLNAGGASFSGSAAVESVDVSTSPATECVEDFDVVGMRQTPDVFVGLWHLDLTSTESTCGRPAGQIIDREVEFTLLGDGLRIGLAPVTLLGRTVEYTAVEIDGTETSTLDLRLTMDGGDATISGVVTAVVSDPDAMPPLDCTEEFELVGRRMSPENAVAIAEYLPFNDGDAYVFGDGSLVAVDSNGASTAVTFFPRSGDSAFGWDLEPDPDDPGGYDLVGVSVSTGVPTKSSNTDRERYYLTPAGVVPAPLNLFPSAVSLGGTTVKAVAVNVLGFVGGSNDSEYSGEASWEMGFGGADAEANSLGMFPRVIKVVASELWLREPPVFGGPSKGRASGGSSVTVWLARGFGPVAVDMGDGRAILVAATVAGENFAPKNP